MASKVGYENMPDLENLYIHVDPHDVFKMDNMYGLPGRVQSL